LSRTLFLEFSACGLEFVVVGPQMLKDKGLTFDFAFTSVLSRAIKTLFYIQDTMSLHWVPVVRDWRLNERHYGSLQGLNKSETAAKHGEEQVKVSCPHPYHSNAGP